MRQFFEAADLDLVVFLVRAGMVGLVAEQFEAGGEFVPLDLRHILDLRAFITETTRKIECQIIHRDHLRSGLEWDAVPAEQAGDLQVTGSRQETDQY